MEYSRRNFINHLLLKYVFIAELLRLVPIFFELSDDDKLSKLIDLQNNFEEQIQKINSKMSIIENSKYELKQLQKEEERIIKKLSICKLKIKEMEERLQNK